MQRRWFTVVMVVLFGLSAGIAAAQAPLAYVSGAWSEPIIALPYGPVAYPGATSALWTNPAGIGGDDSDGLLFMKPTDYTTDNALFPNRYGLALNAGGLGFGVENRYGDNRMTRYTLGLGAELGGGVNLGFAYHWSHNLDRQNSWDVGLLVRPTEWLSVGATATRLWGRRVMGVDLDPAYTAGLALRPFGKTLTVTADATFWKTPANDYGSKINPTFGVSWRTAPGITLRGGYALDSKLVYAGLAFSLSGVELGSYNGFKSESGSTVGGGANWVRFSNQWRPSFLDPILPKRVVRMKLGGEMVENQDAFSAFFTPHRTVLGTIQEIDKLSRDNRVAGLWLDVDGLRAGMSDLGELRDALQRFRDSGKKVMVYAYDYSMGNYYLASVADQVYLYPRGGVTLKGFAIRMAYFKRLLNKLHVDAEFITIGKYKSAPEPLTRSDMSGPAREAYDAMLETIWEDFNDTIAMGRNVSIETVQGWVDKTMFTPQQALDAGMVDGLAFPDEMNDIVKEKIGGDHSWIVSESVYNQQIAEPQYWDNMSTPEIAIIYAVGDIGMSNGGRRGISGGSGIGAEAMVKAIKAARNNTRVKAIVFRVDSPGGSALASDIIAREIKRTVDTSVKGVRHVPVIVSMSDVAASGGYYISALADTIVATRTCITGSIGVLGGKIAYAAGLDSIGVGFDGVQRGKNADLFGPGKWTDDQKAMILAQMRNTYNDFTSVVAEGRGLSQTHVDSIGQGHIWSGETAQRLGLVDVEGGFWRAINIAKDLAGVPESKQIEANIYPVGTGFGIGSEVRAMIRSTLPLSMRETLKAEEKAKRFATDEPVLLSPIDPDELIVK